MVDVLDDHFGDTETLNNDDAGGENRGTVNAHRNEIEVSDLDSEFSDLDLNAKEMSKIYMSMATIVKTIVIYD